MAVMIPDRLPANATQGEKRTFALLEKLPDDTDLLDRARRLAVDLIAHDPALQRSENQRLRERALARYPRAVELFRVG